MMVFCKTMATSTTLLLLLLPVIHAIPLLKDKKAGGRSLFGGGFHFHKDIDVGFNRPSAQQQQPLVVQQSPVYLQQQQRPLVVQQQRPVVIEEQQRPLMVQQQRPVVIEEHGSSVIQQQRPLIMQGQQSSIIRPSNTFYREESFQPSNTKYISGGQQFGSQQLRGHTEEVIGEEIITGNTRVVEEENEEVVEQTRQRVIEEKVPTIIKTKTPTYIQETMKQKLIREQVPEMVQEEHTEYVTETKPIYVTETKPVTYTENKMVMNTRDRVVNVPGETIITKGPTTVTQEQGASKFSVVGEQIIGSSQYQNHYQGQQGHLFQNRPAIGFRSLLPETTESEEPNKPAEDSSEENDPEAPAYETPSPESSEVNDGHLELKPILNHPKKWWKMGAQVDKLVDNLKKFTIARNQRMSQAL